VIADSPIAAIISQTTRAIDEAVNDGQRPPSLDALASAAHISASHLRREFVARVGITPRAYADARRAERLRRQLAAGHEVADAIHDSGFGSASRVYERSTELLGMTPAAARRGAPDETIRYSVVDTSLGRLLVATTERGVCLVAFGNTDAELIAETAERFPLATVEAAGEEAWAWVKAVVALVDDPQASDAADVPLDVRGTVFQQHVWAALRQIRAGETVTYSQLAAAIGRPSAARAVAAACGANPAAVLIPCHRVIGADGSLTGYRWGLARKHKLLEREGAY